MNGLPADLDVARTKPIGSGSMLQPTNTRFGFTCVYSHFRNRTVAPAVRRWYSDSVPCAESSHRFDTVAGTTMSRRLRSPSTSCRRSSLRSVVSPSTGGSSSMSTANGRARRDRLSLDVQWSVQPGAHSLDLFQSEGGSYPTLTSASPSTNSQFMTSIASRSISKSSERADDDGGTPCRLATHGRRRAESSRWDSRAPGRRRRLVGPIRAPSSISGCVSGFWVDGARGWRPGACVARERGS